MPMQMSALARTDFLAFFAVASCGDTTTERAATGALAGLRWPRTSRGRRRRSSGRPDGLTRGRHATDAGKRRTVIAADWQEQDLCPHHTHGTHGRQRAPQWLDLRPVPRVQRIPLRACPLAR